MYQSRMLHATAASYFFAALGLTPSYLRNENRGMAAVQQNITYKHELLAGDIVEIRSRVEELREKSLRFVPEMVNAETGAVAAMKRVALSFQPQSAN